MLIEMYVSGYTPIDIIETIFTICSTTDLIPEIKKIKYIKKIAECHIRIAGGLTTLNQLTGLIAELCSI